MGPKTTWFQNFLETIAELLVAYLRIYKHFGAFSIIFAAAQKAFTVGSEIAAKRVLMVNLVIFVIFVIFVILTMLW